MTKISTLVLRIACLVSACGVLSWNAVLSAADSDQISIGAVLPLSGDAAHWGIPARTGAEMAVEEINHAGGIGGRSLALVAEDDRCSPADGISAFNTIMASAKPPVAVLGAVCSGVTLALAPLAGSRESRSDQPGFDQPKTDRRWGFHLSRRSLRQRAGTSFCVIFCVGCATMPAHPGRSRSTGTEMSSSLMRSRGSKAATPRPFSSDRTVVEVEKTVARAALAQFGDGIPGCRCAVSGLRCSKFARLHAVLGLSMQTLNARTGR